MTRVPVAFLLALLASVGLHLLGAGVLTKLPIALAPAEVVRAGQSTALGPLEIEVVEPSPVEASDVAQDPGERELVRERLADLEARSASPPPEPSAMPEEPEEERPEIRQPAPATRQLQPVQIHSQDPSVESSPDARFVADEASRVEEETVASLRSYSMDAREVEAGESLEPSDAEEPGNADTQQSAEHREREGNESRFATEEEANMERTAEDEQATTLPHRTATDRAGEAPRQRPRGSGEQTQRAERAQREGGGEQWEAVTLSDGEGTFTVRRRVRPDGEGEGNGGGEARVARRGRRGRDRARRGRLGRRGSGRGQGGPDLRLSWNQFEQVLGDERLREERERYVRERLSKQRGRGEERQRRWADFRAAIENYVSDVRPGNQTALNAAASPFASYIAAVHRRLHRHFAERFIANLPGGAGNPFNDMSLRTKLEIVFNGDGSIHRVGVVRTSGLMPFDYGAYNAVMSGQPYPAPPQSIRSGNGKVYLHWSFYRNARQCGAFNAEPFLLPNPPGAPTGQDNSPFVDGPAWGGVVPRDARPTWGVEGGEGEEEAGPGAAP